MSRTFHIAAVITILLVVALGLLQSGRAAAPLPHAASITISTIFVTRRPRLTSAPRMLMPLVTKALAPAPTEKGTSVRRQHPMEKEDVPTTAFELLRSSMSILTGCLRDAADTTSRLHIQDAAGSKGQPNKEPFTLIEFAVHIHSTASLLTLELRKHHNILGHPKVLLDAPSPANATCDRPGQIPQGPGQRFSQGFDIDTDAPVRHKPGKSSGTSPARKR